MLYNNQINVRALIARLLNYYIKAINHKFLRLPLVVYKFFSCSTNIPRGLSAFSKFSAPTIAFLAFWLAKKLRLWANNSRSFTSYGKESAKFKNFRHEVFIFSPGNKNRQQNPVWESTKTIIPFALIMTNSRYALVGYFITSYPTRAHGIIVI